MLQNMGRFLLGTFFVGKSNCCFLYPLSSLALGQLFQKIDSIFKLDYAQNIF